MLIRFYSITLIIERFNSLDESLKIDMKNKTTQPPDHKKSVIPSDRIRASALDKLMHYTHHFHDGQCRCVIRFDGRIGISRLTRAVELSLKAHPILGYRFVYHPWKARWERNPFSNTRIPLRLIETSDADSETNRFLAEPIDSTEGIQVAVCLIRSEYDTLCIKLSHMVADAMGLLEYIRMLSHLYIELQFNPDYIPREAPKCKRGLGQVLRQAGITAMIKGFFNWCYPKSQWGFPQVNSDFSASAFPVRQIGKERLATIKTFCHEGGFKFTDVLTAAFYQALIDVLNPRPGSRLPVQMTVDLRRYLPAGKVQTICNLTGAYYPVIRYSKGRTYDQTLRDVAKAVSAAKAEKSWLGGIFFLELVGKFPSFVHTMWARRVIRQELSGGTSHPFFSNLGVIDPSIVDFLDVKTVDLGLFGPVSFPPNFLATVYTFRGELYINSSFCPSAADQQLADRFFDYFLKYLPA
jgi:NRPS condensation-like uncharacterized protein